MDWWMDDWWMWSRGFSGEEKRRDTDAWMNGCSYSFNWWVRSFTDYSSSSFPLSSKYVFRLFVRRDRQTIWVIFGGVVSAVSSLTFGRSFIVIWLIKKTSFIRALEMWSLWNAITRGRILVGCSTLLFSLSWREEKTIEKKILDRKCALHPLLMSLDHRSIFIWSKSACLVLDRRYLTSSPFI